MWLRVGDLINMNSYAGDCCVNVTPLGACSLGGRLGIGVRCGSEHSDRGGPWLVWMTLLWSGSGWRRPNRHLPPEETGGSNDRRALKRKLLVV
jgi:hypothetical protein